MLSPAMMVTRSGGELGACSTPRGASRLAPHLAPYASRRALAVPYASRRALAVPYASRLAPHLAPHLAPRTPQGRCPVGVATRPPSAANQPFRRRASRAGCRSTPGDADHGIPERFAGRLAQAVGQMAREPVTRPLSGSMCPLVRGAGGGTNGWRTRHSTAEWDYVPPGSWRRRWDKRLGGELAGTARSASPQRTVRSAHPNHSTMREPEAHPEEPAQGASLEEADTAYGCGPRHILGA